MIIFLKPLTPQEIETKQKKWFMLYNNEIRMDILNRGENEKQQCNCSYG
jgi:hypothetical protein